MDQLLQSLQRDEAGNFIISPEQMAQLLAAAATMNEGQEGEPADFHQQAAMEREERGMGNTPVEYEVPTSERGGVRIMTRGGQSQPIAANPKRSIKEIFSDERSATARRNAARGKR